ncbi:Orexin receptor type 2 [Nymphon striatum]|nr:Orexin receptor type 2 [Nymphon striatum]
MGLVGADDDDDNVSVCVSVLTMSAIAVERWFTICCHPTLPSRKRARAKCAILLIWIISFIVSFPHLVWMHLKQNINLENHVYLTDCQYSWGETGDYVFQWLTVVILYFIPVTMMSIAYYQIAKVLWKNKLPGEVVLQLNSSKSIFYLASVSY